MVESRGGRATETKRAFGNTNSPGDAENSSCSPIPYERDNCCACNAGPMLCNRSFGLAPAVAETLPQHRQRGCGFSLMQTRRKSWGRGLLEEMGFSLFLSSCPVPRYFSPFPVSCPIKALGSAVAAEHRQGHIVCTRSLLIVQKWDEWVAFSSYLESSLW